MNEFDWTKVTGTELRAGGSALQRLFCKQAFPPACGIARTTIPSLPYPDCEEVANTALNQTLSEVNARKVETPGAMLRVVTRRKALDRFRNLRARGMDKSVSLDAELMPERADESSLKENVERVDLVQSILATLSPRERQMLKRFHDGASYDDLAAEFNISKGTVGSRLNAIRDKLAPYRKYFLK